MVSILSLSWSTGARKIATSQRKQHCTRQDISATWGFHWSSAIIPSSHKTMPTSGKHLWSFLLEIYLFLMTALIYAGRGWVRENNFYNTTNTYQQIVNRGQEMLGDLGRVRVASKSTLDFDIHWEPKNNRQESTSCNCLSESKSKCTMTNNSDRIHVCVHRKGLVAGEYATLSLVHDHDSNMRRPVVLDHISNEWTHVCGDKDYNCLSCCPF